MADVLELQTFEQVVQFNVRYPHDLGHDGVINYLRSPLSPPDDASVSKHRSTVASPVRIA